MTKNIYYFTLTLALCFLTLSSAAHAQGPSGESILSRLLTPGASVTEAATSLAENSPLSQTGSEDLINSIVSGGNLNLENGSAVLDGFMNGNLNVDDLVDVNSMIQNLQNGAATPEAIQGLLSNVINGDLPTDLGEALSMISDLGQGLDLSSIEGILDLNGVQDALRNFAGIAEASEVLEAITSIASFALDPQALINLSFNDIAESLAQSLEDAIPDVFSLILSELGLDGIIGTFIGQLFSSFGGSLTVPAGASGDYETFPRDPKSSPVAAGNDCNGACSSCNCATPIRQNHINIRSHVTDEFIRHRTWMIDILMARHVLPAMGLMASQLSAVSMNHVYQVGKFFDAKHQMETQRIFGQLMAEAHRDYQPSTGLCEIGTNVRDLAASEEKSNLAQIGLSNRMGDRNRLSADSTSGQGADSDMRSRIEHFKERYCNVNDNSKGLSWLCEGTSPTKERMNKDINITQTLFSKQTLEADFLNSAPARNIDTEDVLALTANLFASKTNPDMSRLRLGTPTGQARAEALKYQNLRSIMAKRSVAENTFSAIAAERVSGQNSAPDSFLKRMVADLGVPENEIDDLMGEDPSYYAQRKVLTSYAYENPRFYTELYESAANVARKDVALKAINLMLEDDFFDRQLESEATLAIMLEAMLQKDHIFVRSELARLEAEARQ